MCLPLHLNILLPLSHIAVAIGHSSNKWFSMLFSHRLHLEGPHIPWTWMLSHVKILHLRMRQHKAAILGHQFPPHIFLHLSSFRCLWVSFSTLMASFMLNLPILEYTHQILSKPSCQGISLGGACGDRYLDSWLGPLAHLSFLGLVLFPYGKTLSFWKFMDGVQIFQGPCQSVVARIGPPPQEPICSAFSKNSRPWRQRFARGTERNLGTSLRTKKTVTWAGSH